MLCFLLFLKKHPLVLCEKTKIAQGLPLDLDAEIKFLGFILKQIGNMNEAPMCFDFPG